MKDIKFRAKDDKKDTITISSELFTQYTGLKDCNQVEIYEGDVIKSHIGRQGEYLGIIEFRQGMFGIKDTFGFSAYDSLRRNEVIGNIYDNPELVDVVKSMYRVEKGE